MTNETIRHEGSTLIIEKQTTDLEAFKWKMPNGEPIYVVFDDDMVHVITLEPGDKPFSLLRSLNETKRVQVLSDLDIQIYMAEAAGDTNSAIEAFIAKKHDATTAEDAE